jgi:hypothetical protein
MVPRNVIDRSNDVGKATQKCVVARHDTLGMDASDAWIDASDVKSA